MSIKHHLDEATLISYSAGAMSQAMAVVVATHLSMCKECRERLIAAENIGGALLETMPSAEMNTNALADLLAAIDEEPVTSQAQSELKAPLPTDLSAKSSVKTNVKTNAKPAASSVIPEPLRSEIGDSFDELDWKKLGGGIHYVDLPYQTRTGGVSRLLRIAPGKSMLPHTHDGNELTLVLQGSFTDEIGRFTAGDVADIDSDIDHQPLVDGNQDCICLVATDAPLKFNTLLGKLVQPMTGF